MKYIKYLLFIVLIVAQAAMFSSCVRDGANDTIDCEKDNTYLNLVFDTRSGSMPSPDDNGETGVASLRVFVYNIVGKLEHTQLYTPASDGRIENPVIKVTPGVKDIYVVVNENAIGINSSDLSTKLSALAVPGAANSSALKALLVKYNSFPAVSSDGLFMTGLAVGQTIPEGKTRLNPQKVVVDVVRNCARLDLRMQKSASSASGTVALKKVEFFNGSDLQNAFEVAGATSNPSGAAYGLSNVAYSSATGLTIANAASASADNYQNVGTYYLTENLGTYTEASHANAEYMVLTYSINGGADKTSRININDIATATNRYNVVRNTCYVMSVTVDFELTINLDILDWNDVAVNGDIYGSRLDVSQSRVVMDWWNLGQSFSTSVDFDADEPVSFIGYYIGGAKVTTLPTWLTINPPTFTSTILNGTFDLTYHITGGTNAATMNPTGATIPANTDGNHPDVCIRLKSGNITKDIRVVYDNGYMTPELMATKGWTQNMPNIGIHIAKIGNLLPDQQAASDTSNEMTVWATNDKSIPSIKDYGSGFGKGYDNTIEIIDVLGDEGLAAKKCEALGEDWMLASNDELAAVLQCGNTFGPSYVPTKNAIYHTSTEHSTYGANTYGVMSSNGLGGIAVGLWFLKAESDPSNVRCVWYRNQLTLGTRKLVADWWNWGKSYSTTVDFTSYDGAVSITAIENLGASKNWLTEAKTLSQSTSNGVTTGKIKVTYTPTVGNSGVHDDVKITVTTAGGSAKTLTVTYDNGIIPESMLPTEWTVNRPVVGLHMSKKGNVVPETTVSASALDKTMRWATVDTSMPVVRYGAYGAGVTNTGEILSTLGSTATAVNACVGLGATWFLASEKEQKTIFDNEQLFGPSYVYTAVNGLYATSTESSSDNSIIAIHHATRESNNRFKSNNSYVRGVCNVDGVLSLYTNDVIADWWAWGQSFTTTVGFTSYDGTVSIASIGNTSVSTNWLTNVAIVSQSTTNGVTSGKVQLTYTPTEGNSGVHDDVVVNLRTPNTNKALTVKYDNGFIDVAHLRALGWTTNLPARGIQITKPGAVYPSWQSLGGELNVWNYVFPSGQNKVNIPAIVEPAVDPSSGDNMGGGVEVDTFLSWTNPKPTFGNGYANTQVLKGVSECNMTQYCTALGPNWYIPSVGEACLIYKSDKLLGPSYSFIYNELYVGTSSSSGNGYHDYLRPFTLFKVYDAYRMTVDLRPISNY